jgi:hypothetical protein
VESLIGDVYITAHFALGRVVNLRPIVNRPCSCQFLECKAPQWNQVHVSD